MNQNVAIVGQTLLTLKMKISLLGYLVEISVKSVMLRIGWQS